MNKKLKLILLILALVIILILIIILAWYFYNQYQLNQRYKQVFPDQPVIKNISNPKEITKMQFSGIQFPNLINNAIYYFNNDGSFNKLDLNTLQGQIIPNINLTPEKILVVKWFNSQKVLIGHINENLYSAIDQGEETIDQAAYHNEQYIALDVTTGQQQLISSNFDLQDAIWSSDGSQIFALEKNPSADYVLSIINLSDLSKSIVYDFGADPVTFIYQNKATDNCIYYTRAASSLKLYKICLDTLQEQPILDNMVDINISPNGQYALVELASQPTYQSAIYDLTKNQIIYTSPMPILYTRAVWDKQGTNLYYLIGENLKMGPEEKLLNRRPSYVFFKYDLNARKNIQLSNHSFTDPLDAQNPMLDELHNKIYFINSYMSEDSLYYLDLNT